MLYFLLSSLGKGFSRWSNVTTKYLRFIFITMLVLV